jgi:hypothetical protein
MTLAVSRPAFYGYDGCAHGACMRLRRPGLLQLSTYRYSQKQATARIILACDDVEVGAEFVEFGQYLDI